LADATMEFLVMAKPLIPAMVSCGVS